MGETKGCGHPDTVATVKALVKEHYFWRDSRGREPIEREVHLEGIRATDYKEAIGTF